MVIAPSNPATLYALTSGTAGIGLFKSTDGGNSWSQTYTNSAYPYVAALVIDPSDPATLYALTGFSGVYKSTDGGASWFPANTGLSSAYVYTLALAPSNPATLYAGTDSGVYKSSNGGGNWSPVYTNPQTYVADLVIDPSNPSTLYAGANTLTDGGIYKSTDGGASWHPFNTTGLPATNVMTLVIDPSNPATLYALTSVGGAFKFTSVDLPTECLFAWAEKNYSGLFAPASSTTAVWFPYTYRHYTATKAYLGVSSIDSHVYYEGADGKTQDEGPTSYWFPLAGCK